MTAMKNWSVRLFLAGLLLCLASNGVCWADEIYLTSGERLKGLVVEEHADRIILSTVDGERTVMRNTIDEVFFDDPERNCLYLGNEALAQADVNAASTLFRKALQLNPEFEEARDAIRRTEDRRQKLNKNWSVPDPESALGAYGLRLSSTDRFPSVAEVKPRSAALAAGFQAGDSIVAIWGESMAHQPAAVAAERLLGLSGTMAKVTLERQAKITPDPKHPWPGFEMEMSLDGLKVSRVKEAGNLAGLKEGDIIHFLNGHPTRYLPLASARNTVAQAKNKRLTLILRRHIFIQRPQSGF